MNSMASKTPITHSTFIQSIPSSVEDLCKKVISELREFGFSQDHLFSVHLAMEEAFVNAIEHGNKMDPAKEVRIDYTVSREKVEVFVTDQGTGFDPESVPDPRCGENLYKPNGRGLLLMKTYMDTVEFNKEGNRVKMEKYR